MFGKHGASMANLFRHFQFSTEEKVVFARPFSLHFLRVQIFDQRTGKNFLNILHFAVQLARKHLQERVQYRSHGDLAGISETVSSLSFADAHSRYINAYVYAYITEECEDNLICKNMYLYGYNITLELKGIVVNEVNVAKFGQLVAKDVDKAVSWIESQCPLIWEEF